jgi:carbamoyl-phosphate synthase large subunit
MGFELGLLPRPDFVAVKIPVFSFAKLRRVETILGPEMKSTGEVLGIDTTYAGALLRGMLGAGINPPPPGGKILFSVSDAEKEASLSIARAFVDMDYQLVATPGTWALLQAHDIRAERVNKIAEGSPHVLDLIGTGKVDLVINNAATSAQSQTDGYRIRRAAAEAGVACLTSLDTVNALLLALAGRSEGEVTVRSLQEFVRPRTAVTQVAAT